MAVAALPFQTVPFDPNSPDSEAAAPRVWIVASAKLPSRFGDFTIVSFANDRDGKEHIAAVHGDVRGAEDVPVRVHSECLTGDVLGSLRCDCRDQLEAGMRYLGAQENGILLYMRQEGRGIGLTNKIRAYALQEQGMDTVEANHALGFEDDERDYAVAAGMLKALGVGSIHLLSNNPKKLDGLRDYGISVRQRIPHTIPPNIHNLHYLKTKAHKSGHLFEREFLTVSNSVLETINDER